MFARPLIGLSLVLLLAGIQLPVGCGGSSKSAAERSPAELTFKRNCQVCHRLPKIKDNTADQWREIMKDHEQRVELPIETKKLITGYLTADSSSK